MSEEIKENELQEEKKCCVCKLCKSEEFKKFLIVALGTFVGVFCALSLFAAIHKPPMMHRHHGHHFGHGHPMMERPMNFHHNFRPEHPMMDGSFNPHQHFHRGGQPNMDDFEKFSGMKKFERPKQQFDKSKIDEKN